MLVSWLGHSCFKVEKDGYSVVFDPYESGYVPGLMDVDESANMVICSHGHNDHNAAGEVKIIESEAKAPVVTEIASYHDDKEGTLRGSNKISVVDFGNEKIVHMGDIGCELNDSQIEALKGADVLLIPVGGFFTIDYKQAVEMVNLLQPKIVVPMHYRDDAAGFGYEVIDTVENFAEASKERSVMRRISEFESSIMPENSVVIMIPRRAGEIK